MSRRFKILFYKTLINVPLSHTFDVMNFNSSKCTSIPTYFDLLYSLLPTKTTPSILTHGISIGYIHSISNHILYNITSPLIKHISKPKHIKRTNNTTKFYSKIKSAFYTGALMRSLTEPLRFIKLSYMVSKGSIPLTSNPKVIQYTTVQDLIDKTYIHKGMKHFYIGLMPSLLAGGISSSIDAGVFNVLRQMCMRRTNEKMSLWKRFVLRSVASCVSKLIVFPLEKANIEMITDNMKQTPMYKGYRDIFAKMYNKKGMRGCFGGIGLVLVSNVVCNGVECALRWKFRKGNKKRKEKEKEIV